MCEARNFLSDCQSTPAFPPLFSPSPSGGEERAWDTESAWATEWVGSASSRVEIRHMAEDRRMSGQNSEGKKEGGRENNTAKQSQIRNPVKTSENMQCYDTSQTSLASPSSHRPSKATLDNMYSCLFLKFFPPTQTAELGRMLSRSAMKQNLRI
ncbi:hypothetical protein ILYODFUR_003905 [Ilyodon furcidens]|uniref:Uncharacterized protein n=1 Tax=Ilyodon furcidens TaxID=33524 RepID=A0ABV0URV1_9TELE